jgi:hypothetical protein
MIYRRTKKEITEKIISELPDIEENVWKELSIDSLLFRWWVTGRIGSGLRLTEEGTKAFEVAKISSYEFPIGQLDGPWTSNKWNILLKTLNKKLDTPYYLGVYRKGDNKGMFIKVYDHQIAMLITIYGNLIEYLESRK